jgi:uncharacterized membrane protein (DUF2068 family)
MELTLPDPPRKPRRQGRGVIILIGLFKLLKGSLLILVAVSAILLTHSPVLDLLRQWAWQTDVGPYRRVLGDWISDTILGLKVRTLVAVAVGSGAYATLFYTEGLGLFFDKLWAEWLTVASTAGLIPLEVYEIVAHHSRVGIVTFVVNAAIVVYLFFSVKRRMRERRAELNARKTPPALARPDAGSCEPGTSSPRSEASASARP